MLKIKFWKDKVLFIMLVMSIIFFICAGPVFAGTSHVDRIAGQDRYETSARVALSAYDTADTVIIARGDDDGGFADGLAASLLAGVLEAPILLTRQNSLPGVIGSALDDLEAERAFILGGTAAVSREVEDSLLERGLEVERIAGEDRSETAVLIAERAREEGELADYAFVVDGHAPADSLVAGPAAFAGNVPILQVSTYRVPSVTREAIDLLGIERIYIVGGTAVVSSSVEKEISDTVSVERLAGEDRFGTSVEVARAIFSGAANYSIVGGFNYADAIGAAVFGNPVLYVNSLPSVIDEYLDQVLTSSSQITIFGGEVAASPAAADAIKAKMADVDEGHESEIITPDVPLEGSRAEVTGSLVNVRTGPGIDYSAIDQLDSGSIISLTGKTGDWYQFYLSEEDNEKGWIAGWLVEKVTGEEEEEEEKEEEKEEEIDEEEGKEEEEKESQDPEPEEDEDEDEDEEEEKEPHEPEEEEEKEDKPEEDPKHVPDFSIPDHSRDALLSSVNRSAMVMKPGVNVRSLPDAGSSIIGRVTYGDWLKILDDKDGWYLVHLDQGKEGWIAGWLVVTRYDSPDLQNSPVLNKDPGFLLTSWKGTKVIDNPVDKPVITDMQVKELDQGIKLQINANTPLELPRVLRLNSPSRLAFDFSGILASDEEMARMEVKANPIEAIRTAQFDEETARVVVDLQEELVHSAIKKNDGRTIEIIFKPVFPLDKTVFIDPGHGTLRSGRSTDPGAIGPSGVTERDVVIDISHHLGEILLSKGYSVVFARENVTSLDNNERGQAASMCGGVFVSVHANAHSNKEIMGTETFYPGTGNGASQEHISTSRDLASEVQRELISSLKRPDRGVKQANFAVLRNSQIPAVLTEVAFISNPEEEKLLVQEEFQKKAARAIAEGIHNYFLKNR
ncbi:MAG: AMIN domain-containing protein [Candidatus Syntrophonatronum acetioxidans]|uniref:AMIN domain-containing protein n=1 Tax=Candidatus Syntrophonatronum acetioxidans TaxID=1795816 RepID=A0A424YHD6_9FIRM|nr:MAG: AMIN domain-containing protein [Candidatus Syntrophonatronum acetioxidans]